MGMQAVPWYWRFLRRVGNEDGRGCLLWTGPPDSAGYGCLGVTSRKIARVHRLAYQLLHGPIPKGSHVHHRCGQKLCVNPGHLELLSHSEHSKRHPPSPEQQEQAREAFYTNSEARRRATAGLIKANKARRKHDPVQLEAMWTAGLSGPEISERLGIRDVSPTISYLRKQGYSFPYRHSYGRATR